MPDSRNHTDHKIRQKLEGAEMALPAGLWDNVKGHIPVTPPPPNSALGRQTLIWLLLLLATIGLTFYLSPQPSSQLASTMTEGGNLVSYAGYSGAWPGGSPSTVSGTNPSITSSLADAPLKTEIATPIAPLESPENSLTKPMSAGEQVAQEEISTAEVEATETVLPKEFVAPTPLETSSMATDAPMEDRALPYLSSIPAGNIMISELRSDSLNYIATLKEDDEIVKWQFGVGLLAGPDLNYRDLQIEVDRNLETHKNDHEARLWRYSAELYGWANRGKVDFRLGLGFTAKGESYSFHHDSINHDTKNEYRYIRVPVMVGYQIPLLDERLTVTPRAGLQTHFLLDAQSSWVDPNALTAVAHSSEGDHHPYRKVALAWHLEAEVALQVTPSLSFTLVPGYSRFAQSVYKKDVPLKQHNFSMDGHLGVRWRFAR